MAAGKPHEAHLQSSRIRTIFSQCLFSAQSKEGPVVLLRSFSSFVANLWSSVYMVCDWPCLNNLSSYVVKTVILWDSMVGSPIMLSQNLE